MKKAIWTCSVTAIAATVIGTAHAEAGGGLEEIIVTAQKRAESVNVVPMSITAVSGDALANAGITEVAALTKIVPGFNAVDSSYGTPIYYLRGIGFFDSTLSAKPTVGVYSDEVPLPYSAMTLGATLDLERVEVLKGPQGTLFGSNATGGAINYIAAKPTRELRAGADLSYGRFSASTVGGFVSGPLNDTLSARIAVHHESRGTWQTSRSRPNDEAGRRDFTTARAQLLWEPTSNFRALLGATGFVDRSDIQVPQFTGVLPVSGASLLPPAFLALSPNTSSNRAADWTAGWPLARDNEFYQPSLRMDLDFLDTAKLTSITSYSHYKQDQSQDADGTTFRISDYQNVGGVQSFNQELRLAGQLGRKLNYVLGGNYENSRFNEVQTQYLDESSAARVFTRFGLQPAVVVPVHNSGRYTNKAVFGNVDFDATDFLTLHGGARYTKTNTEYNACVGVDSPNNSQALLKAGIISAGDPAVRARLLAEAAASGCTTTFSQGGVTHLGMFSGELPEHNVSWRGGVDLKPTDGQLIYANVSRGYKAGSFSGLTGADERNYYPVPQESVTAYELGFKSTLLENTLQLNGAVFYYDYKDKQLKGRTLIPIFGALEALVSIPKSRVQGAELQITAAPVRGLLVSLGTTYIDTEVTSSFVNYNIAGQLVEFKGSQFPYTSKWQVNGDVSYTAPLASSLEGFVGGSVTYRSSANGDFLSDPRFDIKSYTLVDLRAGLQAPDGAWRVSFYGRNITNEYYWTTATRRADSLVRWAGMPATYGVDVTLRFN